MNRCAIRRGGPPSAAIRSATSRHTAARVLGGIVSTSALAHERVPEPVAGLGGLDDAGRQRHLELLVGRVLVDVGDGEQLVGGEDHAEQRHAAGTSPGHRRGSAASTRPAHRLPELPASSSAANGSPPLTWQISSTCAADEVREPVGEQASRGRLVERPQLDAGAGAAAYETVGHLLRGLGDPRPVRHAR